MKFSSLPSLLKVYIVATVGVGLASLSALTFLRPPDNLGMLGILVAFSVIVSIWKVELTVRDGRMTLTSTIVCLAMLLQGPWAAVLCAALGAMSGTMVKHSPGKPPTIRLQDYRAAFNAANCILACVAAAFAYEAARAWSLRALGIDPSGVAAGATRSNLDNLSGIGAYATGAFAFQTVYFLINTAGVSLALALINSQSVLRIWRENFLWTGLSYYVSASVAVVIYAAYSTPYIRGWALILVAPIYFIYHFYRVYVDRMNLYADKVEQDRRHIEELKEMNSAILTSLARAIDAKDRYTRSHINRVQMYSVALGEAAGLSGSELEAVRTGALVHDIGKIGIPERILGKPGKLTPEEFRRIQSHVTIGAEILAPVPFPWPVIPIVLTHHERWDGLGYPMGLKGEDIPIGGRIMAISDVFDALTSNRPYRPAMSLDGAIAVLRDGSGKQFDPRLVELFSQILPEVSARVAEMEAREAALRSGEPGETQKLDSNWALSQIGQSAAEMSAACDLAQGLAEASTVHDVLKVVLDRVLLLLPADTAIIYLCDEGTGNLQATGISGLYSEKLAGLTINRGEGVSGWVAETLQPQMNAQASLDVGRRFNPNEMIELSAAACVPLVQSGATIGVLALYTTGYSVLAEHHLGVINIVAEHTAAALASARRYEQTRELSLTDPLTGLPNSRSLIHHVETLCSPSEGCDPGDITDRFAVMMIDLDGFKQVNDTTGHLHGDEVLRKIADLLRQLTRDTDLPCRYAGDEFVVVLANAGEEEARQFGTRFRQALEEKSKAWIAGGLSASIGIACFPREGRDVRSLLGVADQRMYSDKFNRRGETAGRRRAAGEGVGTRSSRRS